MLVPGAINAITLRGCFDQQQLKYPDRNADSGSAQALNTNKKQGNKALATHQDKANANDTKHR